MHQFLKKISLISLPVLGFVLLTFWQADGRTDPFYLRFTTPKQHSLILGTSRAAQGILPGVIDSVTGHAGMFNYAMTVANSPYGEVYFESIKEKLISAPISASLDERFDGRRDGMFILEVSPWSISSTSDDPNDASSFREADLFLSKIHFFNVNPNIEYLTRFSSKAYIELWNKKSSAMILNSDGWLEVSVPMDSVSVFTRTVDKLNNYRSVQLPKYHLSELRLDYLKKTIAFLKDYGQVILLRLPVHSEMYAIENDLMPDFDAKMESLTGSKAVYLNYSKDGAKYQFTDGNHLWKESARDFSVVLGNDIADLNYRISRKP